MQNINSFFKLCSKITFSNIDIWYISEDITIENDISIESTDDATFIKIESANHIKIKYLITNYINNIQILLVVIIITEEKLK